MLPTEDLRVFIFPSSTEKSDGNQAKKKTFDLTMLLMHLRALACTYGGYQILTTFQTFGEVKLAI